MGILELVQLRIGDAALRRLRCGNVHLGDIASNSGGIRGGNGCLQMVFLQKVSKLFEQANDSECMGATMGDRGNDSSWGLAPRTRKIWLVFAKTEEQEEKGKRGNKSKGKG